jgi:carboxylesterase type B
MFWIHGGAFTSGTGNDPTMDGANIVSRGDVVLVTINYRLGSFGFLALDDGVTKGNYGFADQINALDWVRRNIQDFGGDPNRITVFGQSAGAGSVRAMLASPEAEGKFKGAIPQSNLGGGGYGTTYSQYLTIERWWQWWLLPSWQIQTAQLRAPRLTVFESFQPILWQICLTSLDTW